MCASLAMHSWQGTSSKVPAEWNVMNQFSELISLVKFSSPGAFLCCKKTFRKGYKTLELFALFKIYVVFIFTMNLNLALSIINSMFPHYFLILLKSTDTKTTYLWKIVPKALNAFCFISQEIFSQLHMSPEQSKWWHKYLQFNIRALKGKFIFVIQLFSYNQSFCLNDFNIIVYIYSVILLIVQKV